MTRPIAPTQTRGALGSAKPRSACCGEADSQTSELASAGTVDAPDEAAQLTRCYHAHAAEGVLFMMDESISMIYWRDKPPS